MSYCPEDGTNTTARSVTPTGSMTLTKGATRLIQTQRSTAQGAGTSTT